MKRRLLTALCGLLLCVQACAAATPPRDRCFDEGWRFHRGDVTGAERPAYDDADWRRIDLPHDWSIEDLPPRDRDPEVTVLAVRNGTWRFHRGDDAGWSAATCDDSGWEAVQLPGRWRQLSHYDGSFAWYRRHIFIPASRVAKLKASQGSHDLVLDLGTVMGADETFFNGVRVGGNGSFPPKFESFWSSVYQRQRTYAVPANLLRDGDNVVAVRVYSPLPGVGGIYDPIAREHRVGPFDPGASVGIQDTGFSVGGVGWYRKSFVLPAADRDKSVSIRFDGVYMDSDVWLNGHRLGNHPYGYTTFAYPLNAYLNPAGQRNVIAVRVRNLGRNSRWYSGSGIYRHTWLTVTDGIHVPLWGVCVTTPSVTADSATVKVAAAVENLRTENADVDVRVQVIASSGRVVVDSHSRASVPAGGRTTVTPTFTVQRPTLWSPDAPHLYRARVAIVSGQRNLDETITRFGIRTVTVDAEHGLRINGETVKLRGACLHHDNGPLGSKAIDRAEERRVQLMKANGFNAIRASHNPPSPAFLDECDRAGMLVMDESFDQWREGKNGNDYHRFFDDWWKCDVDAMVLRDRNHPSVVMWSIGNEIVERKTDAGAATAKMLADYVRQLDPTRPVTSSFNEVTAAAASYFSALDVAGYNYNPERYVIDHAQDPHRVIVCTESVPDRAFGYWRSVEDHPWVIGDFVWTGMDYLGESGIGHERLSGDPLQSYLLPWPWHVSYCGDLDICGFKKPQSYYRDVLWGRSKLEMAVRWPLRAGQSEILTTWPDKGQHFTWGWPDEAQSWTWTGHEGTRMQVNVYSRCPQVRLLLNGHEVGTKAVGDAYTATFEVPYKAGELRAIGLVDGRPVATRVLRTAGRAVRLRLTADRARIRNSRNDLAYVTVEAVDAAGTRVPDAAVTVRFEVGGGELAAVGNGDPLDTASFQAHTRRLYDGRALAILRPHRLNGAITLRATAPGLPSATVSVRVLVVHRILHIGDERPHRRAESACLRPASIRTRWRR